MRISKDESCLFGKYSKDSVYQKMIQEIKEAILETPAELIKECKEAKRLGKMLFSPIHLNQKFKTSMVMRYWQTSYKYAKNGMKREIDFYKNGVGVELQLGKYTYGLYDFHKFGVYYAESMIDFGIIILPSHKMTKKMSSGVGSARSLIRGLKAERFNFPFAIIGLDA